LSSFLICTYTLYLKKDQEKFIFWTNVYENICF
jgi:hypothetical protein